ncbi:serine hydrolase domain-containing protein [Halospeciosus flavus]|uniref:Serine hydrolase domain-containing protein n=1 Tax=Halospeciosus flavus TaxID=3032283 RepID=A0ABD5Z619_9EURY|nr:serine hydrolase domain-containing protein [Halospeciosus flavus]
MTVIDPSGAERVRRRFEQHLDVGLHHGAQLAVYRGDERLLDLAGGVTGYDGEATTSDRKHLLFSCTKPLAAAALHHLVDAGNLAYDDRVVDHWTEFAADGTAKAETTVRHVLSHQAGLATTALDANPDAWTDWDASVEYLEDADPAHDPGDDVAYHSLSFGYLVGELVRRASGQSVGAYAREHVFDPLGMDDTYIGLPDSEPDDVATLVGFDPFDRCRSPDAGLATGPHEAAALFNEESVHRAEIPAAAGVGTARDLARFYATWANGGAFDGQQFVSEATASAAVDVQAETESDGKLDVPRRYGLGFVRAGPVTANFGAAAPSRVFGHGGLGSSVAWADPETGLAFAYVTNGVRDSYEHAARVNQLGDAVRAAFDGETES